MNQQTLQDIRVAAEVHAAHASRLIEMREGPLQALAAEPQTSLAANAPPIAIRRGTRSGRLPRARFVEAVRSRYHVLMPRTTSRPLLIRDAHENDIRAIESMVADFVKGHPAENHPRSSQTLRAAYFGERPVAHMLIAERNGQIVGMAQWTLIYDMFWGMFGAEAAWLYVRPDCRGSGIVAALVARLCAQAAAAGAQFLHGGGGEGPSRLYQRVAIGQVSRECHLSAKAFQVFSKLDGLLPREIVRRLPAPELGLQPAEP